MVFPLNFLDIGRSKTFEKYKPFIYRIWKTWEIQ